MCDPPTASSGGVRSWHVQTHIRSVIASTDAISCRRLDHVHLIALAIFGASPRDSLKKFRRGRQTSGPLAGDADRGGRRTRLPCRRLEIAATREPSTRSSPTSMRRESASRGTIDGVVASRGPHLAARFPPPAPALIRRSGLCCAREGRPRAGWRREPMASGRLVVVARV